MMRFVRLVPLLLQLSHNVSAVSGSPQFTAPYVVLDTLPPLKPSDPIQLASVGGTLLFWADSDVHDRALWRSDGTPGGTSMIHPVDTNFGHGDFGFHAVIGDWLYFSASELDGGELWKSDGTTAGTMQVKDIWPGSKLDTQSRPSKMTNVNGTLFFGANGGPGASGLWKSDGTEAGTNLVHIANSSELAAVGDILFFSNLDGTIGQELWRSDGTTAGTHLVKDIKPGNLSGNPQSLTDVGGRLFFTAVAENRRQLWISDGTELGTQVIKDIDYFGLGSETDSAPREITNVNGTAFFSAGDRQNGVELWKSDGTEAGTVIVKNIRNLTFPMPNPSSSLLSSNPDHLTNVNGTLYFTADDGVQGRELWKSDGTEAGTKLVADLTPGIDRSNFYYRPGPGPQIGSELLAVDDLLFFTAGTRNVAGGFDNSLFVTDGSAAGTRPLITFSNTGFGPPPISELTFTGSHLFFRGLIQHDVDGVTFGRYGLYALAVVPEAASVSLIGTAVAAIIGFSRRKRISRSTSSYSFSTNDRPVQLIHREG